MTTSEPDQQVGDQLLRYLSGARWFAGKGRRVELRSLVPLPWLTPVEEFDQQGLAVRIEIVEVAYPGEEPEAEAAASDDAAAADHAEGDVVAPEERDRSGPVAPAEHYQLAVAYRPAPRSDLHHAELARLVDPDLGQVVAYDAAQDPEACRVLVRSLIAGDRLRDRHGEVRFHSTEAAPLHADLVPKVFGGQQSNTSVLLGDVAIVKLFRRLELGRNLDIEVHDALNRAGIHDVAALYGWIEASWDSGPTTLNADLAMVVEQLSGAVDGWALALTELRAGNDFSTEAAALGRALAETHHALRGSFPGGQVPGGQVADLMSSRLDAAISAAAALKPHRDGLTGAFGALSGRDLAVQRVHGDFHLGQTLHTPDGWKIIDFEGEPAKTMAERLLPDSPWRDIAGMLRSFDYAAASAPGPDSAGWAAACRAGFLAGYTGGSLTAEDAAVLRAYEADKAVYEVVYEVRNRPDWVAIPLAAVATLAASAGGTQGAGPPANRGDA